VDDSVLTQDGYDMTIKINHIAHVAMVMRPLDSFDTNGRIVLFSSIDHFRKPNATTKLIPNLPDGSDDILHPSPSADKLSHVFQRYGTSKFLITTWMYPLNQYL
jgi:NAD(P)-dependent dehydrogenase (short-subunit alcohol dehydrogenase family)